MTPELEQAAQILAQDHAQALYRQRQDLKSEVARRAQRSLNSWRGRIESCGYSQPATPDPRPVATVTPFRNAKERRATNRAAEMLLRKLRAEQAAQA